LFRINYFYHKFLTRIVCTGPKTLLCLLSLVWSFLNITALIDLSPVVFDAVLATWMFTLAFVATRMQALAKPQDQVLVFITIEVSTIFTCKQRVNSNFSSRRCKVKISVAKVRKSVLRTKLLNLAISRKLPLFVILPLSALPSSMLRIEVRVELVLGNLSADFISPNSVSRDVLVQFYY
jgi:hypothetical protein